ncbi:peptidylprolyl isomerase [Vibrio sp.]|uniref:peptidylprolyl isomerase n=1 Tax=Vibrio sp. TaxID=678 RepID=UPI003D0A2F20
MMERLREGANSIAIKIILGLIILSFVFAGIGSYLVGGGNNAAAKVGGAEISLAEFEQAYQNERSRMQSQLGEYFSNLLADPNYVETFRKSVLDRMINDLLLEQHAESLGFRVSDAQVRKLILEMPQFQSDGKFDQEIYQSALRRAGFNAESFAEYLRRDLVKNQLINGVQGSDFSLQGEVLAHSKLVSQKRDIRKLTLSTQELAKTIELTDQDIEQYYQQNPARFTRPEQVKVAYLQLSAEALKDTIEISDEQAKAYYQEHLDKYSTAEQRSVSHILIEGDDEDKAQAILDELNAGADFAKLAEEKSDDFGSASQGGSLGWIERNVMDPTFEEAAFGLAKVGDISGLVKSDFGYHIIKLDEVKQPESQPYEQVVAEIKQELANQQAVDKFYELQSELERTAFEFPDSLTDAAQATGQKVETTDFVSQADAPQLLQTPAIMQAILSPEVKDEGLNSEVLEVAPEHVVVVRVTDHREEQVLPLEEVRDQAVSQLTQLKAEQKGLTLAKELVAGLQEGNQQLLKDNDLSFGDVETIDRSSALADTVFSLTKPANDKPVYAEAKELNGDIVVIELVKVSEEADGEVNKQVAQQLDQLNAQQDISGLLSILRSNSDIEYYAVSQ